MCSLLLDVTDVLMLVASPTGFDVRQHLSTTFRLVLQFCTTHSSLLVFRCLLRSMLRSFIGFLATWGSIMNDRCLLLERCLRCQKSCYPSSDLRCSTLRFFLNLTRPAAPVRSWFNLMGALSLLKNFVLVFGLHRTSATEVAWVAALATISFSFCGVVEIIQWRSSFVSYSWWGF